jgi:hypothetical protein
MPINDTTGTLTESIRYRQITRDLMRTKRQGKVGAQAYHLESRLLVLSSNYGTAYNAPTPEQPLRSYTPYLYYT